MMLLSKKTVFNEKRGVEQMKRIGVLVSGSGSNLQAIIDAIEEGKISGEIAVVISNKPDVFALKRAEKYHIPTAVISHKDYDDSVSFTSAIVECLLRHQTEIVCLAGFMRILDRLFTDAFPNRILNIHPALLPAFGGKGMYGHHVHDAVIASGAKYSGATVHLVTPETDVGPIMVQGVVNVEDNDTSESLAARVLEVEHKIFPQAVQMLLEGNYKVEGLRVKKL